MSDLKDRGPDQQGRANHRSAAANRLRRDRSSQRSDRRGVVCVLLLLTACVRPSVPLEGPGAPQRTRTTLWIDGAASDGDGSREHPKKTLPAELRGAIDVHVRSGLYAGPFHFSSGVRVEGHGEVVLTGEAKDTVVTCDDATLVHLSVQGGAIGVGGTAATLQQVRLSGQRRVGIQVTGAATLAAVKVVGRIPDVDGVVAGSLRAEGLTLEGGLRRGVSVERGELTVRDLKSEGVRQPVHAVDSKVVVRGAQLGGGVGPALFLAGGLAELSEVHVDAHDYGLLCSRGAQVTAKALEVRGTGTACVSAQDAAVTLTDSRLERCGRSAGVEASQAVLRLERVQLSQLTDVGVLARGGTVALSAVKVDSVRGDAALGDGVHLRGVQATIAGLEVADVRGNGLTVSSGSVVQVDQLFVSRARLAGVFVELGSKVSLVGLLVRGGSGTAVLVPDAAEVHAQAIAVAGGADAPIYAECDQGAQVFVGRLESTIPQPPSRCVQRAPY